MTGDSKINSIQNAERGLTMFTLTKAHMVEVLQVKGVKVNSKMKKDEVATLFESKSKVRAMGNRTGEWYFGSKQNTWAGKVCEGIAHGELTSTADIREKVTRKYGFTQTLGRLNLEGLIRFVDDKKKRFELTSKGREVAAMYKSRYAR